MGKNAEVQIRILVENFAVGIRAGSEMRCDKFGIGAGFFGVLANAFAAGGARILEQRRAAIGGELVNV